VEDWNSETIFYRYYRSIYLQLLWYNWPENLPNSVKKKHKIRAITALKVIKGHRGWYQSKVLCDFLLVINSNWHPIGCQLLLITVTYLRVSYGICPRAARLGRFAPVRADLAASAKGVLIGPWHSSSSIKFPASRSLWTEVRFIVLAYHERLSTTQQPKTSMTEQMSGPLYTRVALNCMESCEVVSVHRFTVRNRSTLVSDTWVKRE